MVEINIKKYGYIDVLRGYAILMVLFVHFGLEYNGFINYSFIYNLFMLGQYGVVLFFIVSSYTLTRSLTYRKNNNESKLYVKYFLRRFLRIAPLYYIVLLISFFCMKNIGLIDGGFEKNYSILNLILHLLFLDQFSVATINNIINVEWTISVEFFFYAFLCFIFFWDTNRLKKLFIFSLLLSVFIMVFRKYYYIDGWWLHYTIFEWLYVFVGGGNIV